MSDFLRYWKDYWKDRKNGDDNFDEMWHFKTDRDYQKVELGDTLWFLTRNLHSDEWRLISQVFVEKKNPDFNKDKPYGIFGDKEKSRRFNTESQSDFASIIHKIEFESRKKIEVSGNKIGNRLQSLRRLTEADSFLLKKYSKKLELIQSAK